MKVTCLIENLPNNNMPELANEHGLSFFIEIKDHNILFDMGASELFAQNAQKLGIDLSQVDIAILSHGHYDHSGGLDAFFKNNENAPLYLSSKALERHFSRAFFLIKREIGVDQAVINQNQNRLKFIDKYTEILPDIYLLSIQNHKYPLPAGNRYLYRLKNSRLVRHELLLVIKGDKGLILFTGCAHNGILNMVDVACQKFPETPINAIFGGFHMIGLPYFNHMAEKKKNVRAIGKKLTELPIEKVYTGHCTGKRAYPILKEVMGEKIVQFPPGSVYEDEI
jgi:7,8-dihydropterin-6-yl-methyl-4-(beta-D-ribofuranosyl)aminobenzene 5'-phosphate synthase